VVDADKGNRGISTFEDGEWSISYRFLQEMLKQIFIFIVFEQDLLHKEVRFSAKK
jgi:hypothetical protein